MNKSEEYKRIIQARNKRYTYSFLSMLTLFISITFFVLSERVSELLLLPYRTIIITAIILFIVGIYFIFFTFLKNIPNYYRFEENSQDVNSIFSSQLKRNLTKKYGNRYYENENEIEDLFTEIEIQDLKNKFYDQVKYDLEYAYVFEDLYNLESKFKSQIERLISNSNLNLLIGIITTMIAVIILGITIFQDNKFNNYYDLLSFFLPRISTVIFIELFSFFFLRLYRDNLSEIKFFQNEISNLNFKITSLKSAIKKNDDTALTNIINEYSKTERNFILKNGETTEKIESLKQDYFNNSYFGKSIVEFINKK